MSTPLVKIANLKERSPEKAGFGVSTPFKSASSKLTWAIWFLFLIHAMVVLAGFIAPYSFETQEREHPFASPTRLHFVLSLIHISEPTRH